MREDVSLFSEAGSASAVGDGFDLSFVAYSSIPDSILDR